MKKAFTLENFDIDKKLNDTDMELLKRELCLDDSGKHWFLSYKIYSFQLHNLNFYAKC